MNQIIIEKQYLDKLIKCSPKKLEQLVQKSTYHQVHTIIQCVLHCNNINDLSIIKKKQKISKEIRKIKKLSKAKAFIIKNKETIIPLVAAVIIKVFEKVLFS
jgi:hypothetical protein